MSRGKCPAVSAGEVYEGRHDKNRVRGNRWTTKKLGKTESLFAENGFDGRIGFSMEI
jgi:hypothetical protein